MTENTFRKNYVYFSSVYISMLICVCIENYHLGKVFRTWNYSISDLGFLHVACFLLCMSQWRQKISSPSIDLAEKSGTLWLHFCRGTFPMKYCDFISFRLMYLFFQPDFLWNYFHYVKNSYNITYDEGFYMSNSF